MPNPPDGDTYYHCQTPCKSCRLENNNCFSCENNNYFYSDDINKCKPSQSSYSNYFLKEDTYLERDESCDSLTLDNNKKKCDSCSNGYFKYDNNEHFCYSNQEIFSKFGINNFLDNDKYKSCEEGCLLCSGSNNCLKCEDEYFFVKGLDGKCMTKNQIDELSDYHYYLPNESDTYYKCEGGCVCSLKKDHCTSCDTGNWLIENEYKCYNTPLNGYYKYQNSIFKKCHYSCLTCNGDGPNKCTTCSDKYYEIELDDGHRIYALELLELNKPTESENHAVDDSSVGSESSTLKTRQDSTTEAEEPSAENISQSSQDSKEISDEDKIDSRAKEALKAAGLEGKIVSKNIFDVSSNDKNVYLETNGNKFSQKLDEEYPVQDREKWSPNDYEKKLPKLYRIVFGI